MSVQRICQNKRCGISFPARQADVNRGWALYCGKRCKAIAQEAKTHQHRDYLNRGGEGTLSQADRDHESAMDDAESGWDGHK